MYISTIKTCLIYIIHEKVHAYWRGGEKLHTFDDQKKRSPTHERQGSK